MVLDFLDLGLSCSEAGFVEGRLLESVSLVDGRREDEDEAVLVESVRRRGVVALAWDCGKICMFGVLSWMFGFCSAVVFRWQNFC